ncbi:hypothetical protein N8D56_08150 [Devosia sp. A8/3-2]|nr:hypothetical protein N8D56_08150 [Devosia sp. A8/3-2]
MRYALSGSAPVHASIFGIAFVGFARPQPEDAAAGRGECGHYFDHLGLE